MDVLDNVNISWKWTDDNFKQSDSFLKFENPKFFITMLPEYKSDPYRLRRNHIIGGN